MKTAQNTIEVAIWSWGIALLVGTLAGVMLWTVGDWSFIQGLFVGGIVTLVVGFVVSTVMTKPLPAPDAATIEPADPAQASTRVSKTPPTVEANKGRIKPTAPLPGQTELAARKGDWTYQSAAPTAAAAHAKPSKTPAAPAEAPVQQSSEPVTQGNTEGRPANFSDAPRDTGADDLKLIGGVGPKLEGTLNSLGIWHFEQVAALTEQDIAWVDERLRFKGRIERDDWLGQAKILAEGGDTEFSKKKRKS
ncbi:MAG: hypothetical protein AAF636_17655 [Pseudomonadota bacterium]